MWSQVGLRKHHYKVSGGDGIPVELFQILKDDAVQVLHSMKRNSALKFQQIWKTQQWSQDWKQSVFIPIPKKGKPKEGSNYHTIAFMSQVSKVMLKILQTRLLQYVNWELPDVQAGFRKGRETTGQIANIHWIIERAREFQKNICFIDYAVWIITNCGKFLEMEIPDHLTCLLRNLYSNQEATVRNRHGTTDWFQIGKGVHQGYILSPCLFNLYAGLIKYKLESRLSGEMSIISDMQMTLPLWQKAKVKVKSLSRVRLFATLWTVAYQHSPSMGFSRWECWSGLPFPSPRDLPDPGIEPVSIKPALQADTLTPELPGKP